MHPAIINKPALPLKAELSLPGDKSITHRAIFISAIAEGRTKINNFLFSGDCLVTINAFRKLGLRIITDKKNKRVIVYGKGLLGLSKPNSPLELKESGTTMRLLAGLLAGQDFSSKLCAGKALSLRPMRRITVPLRMMGAVIKSKIKKSLPAGRQEKSKIEEYPPLTLKGGGLKAISYRMPVASAQVKSALLLAGLYAKGQTKVIEPIKTRDHTERLLKLFAADIKIEGLKIRIKKSKLISSGLIDIPADASSSAFFIVLAALLPEAHLSIKSVGINPTRTGIIDMLKYMGAEIKVSKCQSVKVSKFEPVADIIVKNSRLKAIIIKAKEIPSIIDELPILMVAACLARGKTVIEGVSELRVKETDRINSMVTNLTKMGADIRLKMKKIKGVNSECLEIYGIDRFKAAKVKSFGDHRTAMSAVVAGLLAEGKTRLDDVGCIDKSFPEFVAILRRLLGRNCIKLS